MECNGDAGEVSEPKISGDDPPRRKDETALKVSAAQRRVPSLLTDSPPGRVSVPAVPAALTEVPGSVKPPLESTANAVTVLSPWLLENSVLSSVLRVTTWLLAWAVPNGEPATAVSCPLESILNA